MDLHCPAQISLQLPLLASQHWAHPGPGTLPKELFSVALFAAARRTFFENELFPLPFCCSFAALSQAALASGLDFD